MKKCLCIRKFDLFAYLRHRSGGDVVTSGVERSAMALASIMDMRLFKQESKMECEVMCGLEHVTPEF